MNMTNSYQILLFYKFVHIDHYEQFASEHLEYCKQLGLKGRILIAEEGINGTVSGTIEQTNTYMDDLRSNPLFQDVVFKIDPAEHHAFKKMFVRPRKEIVTFHSDYDLSSSHFQGKRLSPTQFYEQLQNEDVIVLDGRNNYEYDIGHFRNAIRPDVDSFRDFPQWIRENLSDFKDKPIITYCTGGIRCEKLTSFMLLEGFKDVAQLDGGIITYGQDAKTQGKLFDGKCYVFDERISVPINRTNEDVIVGKCHHCGKPEDRYINCANDFCHLQHICCEDCEKLYNGFCSEECAAH